MNDAGHGLTIVTVISVAVFLALFWQIVVRSDATWSRKVGVTIVLTVVTGLIGAAAAALVLR